ncbi:hypothetical protein HanRHA438_Chr03g0121631 [Helianthus annuus]|nr:hypothetical protein HanRHA438_Chr03g0121631 [Helianthus annuus]
MDKMLGLGFRCYAFINFFIRDTRVDIHFFLSNLTAISSSISYRSGIFSSLSY